MHISYFSLSHDQSCIQYFSLWTLFHEMCKSVIQFDANNDNDDEAENYGNGDKNPRE